MQIRQSQFSQTDPSLARLQRGYAALFALVDDLPEARRDQPGACGEWSPRQILAHLSGWLEEARTRFVAIQGGDLTNKQYDRESDHAAFNHASVTARANLSWDETVADLRQSFDQFVGEAQAVDTAALGTDDRYSQWLEELWQDCVEHMGQLCRFVLA